MARATQTVFSVQIMHQRKYYEGAILSQCSLRNCMVESAGANINILKPVTEPSYFIAS
jgi:hypothetical protein